MSSERAYLKLLQELVDESEKGNLVQDRTGVGTYNLFHRTLRFDLSKGFPLLTTKRMFLKSILGELIWFISGSTNANTLKDKYGCTIWEEWQMPYVLDKKFVSVKRKSFDYIPYHGNFRVDKRVDKELRELLYQTWMGMMKRCYDPNDDSYRFYGEKGVSVSKEWHDFSCFVKDVQNIPQWWYKLNNPKDFTLDKDYFGSNQYNKESCVWLHHKENKPYKVIVATSPSGVKTMHGGLNECSETLNISESSLSRFIKGNTKGQLKGNNKKFKGWSFDYFDDSGEILLRKELIQAGELGKIYGHQWRNFNGFDQISWLINEIKTNPTSRRLYVTGANPNDRYSQALDCCHNYFQVVIKNGKLNLYFQMRSTDVFLGLPYNIASYAVLAHMLALETGYEVGELVYSGVDVHLYSNHIEQAKEQLSRQPFGSPRLVINKKPFFDYELSDFDLKCYVYHPTIKADVAV